MPGRRVGGRRRLVILGPTRLGAVRFDPGSEGRVGAPDRLVEYTNRLVHVVREGEVRQALDERSERAAPVCSPSAGTKP